MAERHKKVKALVEDLANPDSSMASRLFQEVFYGTSGRQSDPGMTGSLLYHMAMVTKMETETRILLEALNMEAPDVSAPLQRFYGEFVADSAEFVESLDLPSARFEVPAKRSLSAEEKIRLFTSLNEKTRKVARLLNGRNSEAVSAIEALFVDWAEKVVEMRLWQEYETIKGLLTLSELARLVSLKRLETAMENVQTRFSQETVSIALNVTLKVGLRREKLQAIMLSDHYINYTMSVDTLDGRMEFLNCPIHGAHRHIGEKLGISDAVASLFCTHFCFAHAQAMLETVLPFTFTLSQPQRMATHGKCEFYLKLGHSPTAKGSEKFVPLVVSWNLTRRCNLKCPHCYINAAASESTDELTTEESKRLIDQISEVSRPMLILSGGEPLLRGDVYELVRYGTHSGLKMAVGSNGALIDSATARKLREAGIKTVSISLDSSVPERHDEFRGAPGSWQKAVNAIKALRESDVLVQVNTTLTQQNYGEIDDIMTLAENLGVENFHLFFLVPTGRGAKLADVSPEMYEHMIKTTFAKTGKHRLNVRPSCAPQFMRIAKDMNMDMRQWIRGCIAGLYYCRVFPNGDITPCPYLPVKLGNIREQPFRDIWFGSEVFRALRDSDTLKGKCGACEHRNLCGGCRARAYGLSGDFIDYCGDPHEPTGLRGDYLAEDPWCVYQPKKAGMPSGSLGGS
ncbi:MAG: radical SAM protein [Candidatus Bathyarchaeia archaeon]